MVDGNNIKGYIDDKLYFDYTQETTASLYETASLDANGDIILKFVNTSEQAIDINTTLTDIDMGSYNTSAAVTVLKGDSLSAVNSFEEPDKLVPSDTAIDVNDNFNFTYKAPKYSVSIVRIQKK